jgi:hypothetical protein
MLALDATTREICMMRRQRTSTPLAALVMLNDPTFVEASRVLAERLLRNAGPEVEDCIRQGFERTVSRQPSDMELAELMALYEMQLAIYRDDRQSAEELLAVGESQHGGLLPADQHAALTCVASVLLNLDETISKE